VPAARTNITHKIENPINEYHKYDGKEDENPEPNQL
jgi:hypothetical protein